MTASAWDQRDSIQKGLQVATLLAATFASSLRQQADASFIETPRTDGEPGISANSAQHTHYTVRLISSLSVTNVHELIELWSPAQHLYHTGNIGLSNRELGKIELALREHPNWTVYLVERCEDEQYVDRQGKRYFHNEAIEYALGVELRAKQEFRELQNPDSGEANGNILIITFDSNRAYRKVAYLASKAYDARGVGESRWQGDLDQIAIAALRDGRRVHDAIVDTISHIDSGLQARIAEEKSALKTEVDETLRDLHSAVAVIQRHSPPEALAENSDISSFDIGKAVTNAEALATKISISKPTELARLKTLASETQQIAEALTHYGTAADEMTAASQNLLAIAANPALAEKSKEVAAAKGIIDNSRAQHTAGDRRYYKTFEEAKAEVAALESIITAKEKWDRTIKIVLQGGAGLAALALGAAGGGYVASRFKKMASILQEIDDLHRQATEISTAADLRAKDLANLSASSFTGRTAEIVADAYKEDKQIQVELEQASSILRSWHEALEPQDDMERLRLVFGSSLEEFERSLVGSGDASIRPHIDRARKSVDRIAAAVSEVTEAIEELPDCRQALIENLHDLPTFLEGRRLNPEIGIQEKNLLEEGQKLLDHRDEYATLAGSPSPDPLGEVLAIETLDRDFQHLISTAKSAESRYNKFQKSLQILEARCDAYEHGRKGVRRSKQRDTRITAARSSLATARQETASDPFAWLMYCAVIDSLMTSTDFTPKRSSSNYDISYSSNTDRSHSNGTSSSSSSGSSHSSGSSDWGGSLGGFDGGGSGFSSSSW